MSKVFDVIKTVLGWALVVFAVGIMIFTIISVNTFNQNDRNIFGYKAFVVRTDSMAKTDFDAGDLILVREVDPTTLVEGDIISFISTNPDSYGETVTHKIRRKTVDADGEAAFVTYGTTTDTDDETLVSYSFVVGKYQGKIPKLGSFFMFLKEPQGYIMFIFIPFLALIVYQGINTILLFRRYRREQIEELEREKARIAAEREQAAKMMRELEELRAQMRR